MRTPTQIVMVLNNLAQTIFSTYKDAITKDVFIQKGINL